MGCTAGSERLFWQRHDVGSAQTPSIEKKERKEGEREIERRRETATRTEREEKTGERSEETCRRD